MEDIAASFDLSKKKRRSKKKSVETIQSLTTDPANYSYDSLLKKIPFELNQQTEIKKLILKPPRIVRISTRKVSWTNFNELCSAINRNPEHVMQFFLEELSTTGVINGAYHLIINGRYRSQNIETLIKQYVNKYVICRMCRSSDTKFERNATNRLYFINCQLCSATRTVPNIHAGYHATTKADRSS